MQEASFDDLASILSGDNRRIAALRLVRDLRLPEGAIAGDFVRCAAFDRLHRHPESTQLRRVDVVYFDPSNADSAIDRSIEAELLAHSSRRPWRVRNLASERSEARGLSEALAVYLDTASAVGVRLTTRDEFEFIAPFGVRDLLRGIVRPTDAALAGELRRQVRDERWAARYPSLRYEDLDPN